MHKLYLIAPTFLPSWRHYGFYRRLISMGLNNRRKRALKTSLTIAIFILFIRFFYAQPEQTHLSTNWSSRNWTKRHKRAEVKKVWIHRKNLARLNEQFRWNWKRNYETRRRCEFQKTMENRIEKHRRWKTGGMLREKNMDKP